MSAPSPTFAHHTAGESVDHLASQPTGSHQQTASMSSEEEVKHNSNVEHELEKGHPQTAAVLSHELQADEEHVRFRFPCRSTRATRQVKLLRLTISFPLCSAGHEEQVATSCHLGQGALRRPARPCRSDHQLYVALFPYAPLVGEEVLTRGFSSLRRTLGWAASVWNQKTRHRWIQSCVVFLFSRSGLQD